MPKFTVTETVPCVQVWTYEVEAANETEALDKVMQGKVEMQNTFMDEHDYDEAQYEIEDAE
jgi:hypothetical protein